MADGVKVTIVGRERFRSNLQRKDRAKALAIQNALNLSGLDVVTEARHLIQDGSRSGTRYVRYNPRREGVAGKQFLEPPKQDRGTLAGSIFQEPKVPINEVRVGTRLNYGRSLELNGWRWLSPAFNNMLPRIRARLREAAGR